MKLLVVGSGGREHALAWKLAQSPRVQMVYVAPGNGGTALEPNLENLPITDIGKLADFAQKEHIYLTVVGPEAPLAAGIVDEFRTRGLKIFGPTAAAAQLESSKDFAKSFMVRHGIPTAEHRTFSSAAAAHEYVDLKGAPIVIKADGLAAGKGVVVAMSAAEAHEAIDFMLLDNKLGVSHNAGGERAFRADHGQGDLLLQRPVAQLAQIGDGDVLQPRVERGAAVAGRHVDGLHLGGLREFPRQGVLAAAAAND